MFRTLIHNYEPKAGVEGSHLFSEMLVPAEGKAMAFIRRNAKEMAVLEFLLNKRTKNIGK